MQLKDSSFADRSGVLEAEMCFVRAGGACGCGICGFAMLAAMRTFTGFYLLICRETCLEIFAWNLDKKETNSGLQCLGKSIKDVVSSCSNKILSSYITSLKLYIGIYFTS